MKIEVWSDFVCPFCYIGKRRLEMALEQFPHKKDVEVEFKSFELDQNAPIYSGTSINEVLASKYGISIEEAKRNNVQLGNHAASMGLSFNFDEMKPTNTFDAHRLAKFARIEERKRDYGKSPFAYFTESRNLSDVDTLATIAEASGLDKEEALRVINDKRHMLMMLELMKRLLSNIKFQECLILLLIKSMLFQVHNHLKLLLVHFSKCGKKRIQHLSYKSFLQKVEAICFVRMKVVRYLQKNNSFMRNSNPYSILWVAYIFL